MKTLVERSTVAAAALERHVPRIIAGWIIVAGLVCALRYSLAAFGPRYMQPAAIPGLLNYLLIVATPAVFLWLSLRWFSEAQPQPRFRFARLGRWRDVGAQEAAAHPLHGPNGLMFSLLIGMLLNVPVRTMEYLAAIPPSPAVQPLWLRLLSGLCLADVVLFSAFYVVCFAAALKRHPLFPRLLAAVWLFDLTAQIAIRSLIHLVPGAPESVVAAVDGLFTGNIKKVLISMALWMPYLLLSRRVNITYRHRIRA